MCKWGNVASVKLTEPDYKGCKTAHVDRCIAPLVQALNDAGIKTIASCCGHKKPFGNIVLGDGRELIIVPDFEISRKAENILGTHFSNTETRKTINSLIEGIYQYRSKRYKRRKLLRHG